MLKNAITYPEICDICVNVCAFLYVRHMRHNFHPCAVKNAIICGKICDMLVLAIYAIAYVIAYSHITSIPNYYYMFGSAMNGSTQALSRELLILHCCGPSVGHAIEAVFSDVQLKISADGFHKNLVSCFLTVASHIYVHLLLIY